jgi:hypothetical protein
VTHVILNAIAVDGGPDDIRLDLADGMRVRLAPGIHLDLSQASEDTLATLADAFAQALHITRLHNLPVVA